MPYVILDRDGVINQDSEAYIKSPDEWIPLPGSLEAIADLTRAGFRTIVCSNQSGLARGLFDRATLDAIHATMCQAVTAHGGAIEAIFYCPHGPDDQCHCRKPRPGLLEQFAHQYHEPLADLPVIGDSWRDLQAALAVGAAPMLVLTGNGRATLAAHPDLSLPVFPDLYAASRALLARSNA